MKLLKLPLLLMLMAFSVNCPAADISISASVDRQTISIDEQLTLQLSISGDVSSLPQPKLPTFPGFTAYSSGRSQNVSIINGRVSSSIVFKYILAPHSAGKYTIPSFTLNYKGKTYKTNPIEVEVTSGHAKPAPSAPTGKQVPPAQSPQISGQKGTSKDIFVTMNVDKKKAYVDEQITMTFAFYRRIRLLSQPAYSPPDTSGFWTEDLPPQKNYQTTINGVPYAVTEVRTALFPTTDGKFTIGSASLKCNIEDFNPFNDDFFRSFFSQGKTRVLKTNPIKITVLPLPAQGRPSNFSGNVGNYHITAQIDRQKVKVNEPVTLKIKISGEGNIKTIACPKFPALANFKQYETVSSFNLSKENYKVHGSKTYSTVIVPKVSGRQTIPAINFSFFDPISKRYKTLHTKPLTLIVASAPEKTLSAGITPEGINIIEKDIRYIKTTAKLRNHGAPLIQNTGFIVCQFIPLLALIILVQYKNHTQKLNEDIRYARLKRADKIAYRKLKKANNFLSTDRVKEFYATISEIITGYLADKLNLSKAGLTISTIEREMRKKNAPDESIERTKEILERSDFARFAPGELTLEDMKQTYQLTSDLLRNLRKYI